MKKEIIEKMAKLKSVKGCKVCFMMGRKTSCYEKDK